MPPAAITGTRTASTTCGTRASVPTRASSRHVQETAAVATGFGALGDDGIHPAGLQRQRLRHVGGGADHARATGLQLLHQGGAGVAEGEADQRHTALAQHGQLGIEGLFELLGQLGWWQPQRQVPRRQVLQEGRLTRRIPPPGLRPEQVDAKGLRRQRPDLIDHRGQPRRRQVGAPQPGQAAGVGHRGHQRRTGRLATHRRQPDRALQRVHFRLRLARMGNSWVRPSAMISTASAARIRPISRVITLMPVRPIRRASWPDSVKTANVASATTRP